MTITEFLLARIVEDEGRARAAIAPDRTRRDNGIVVVDDGVWSSEETYTDQVVTGLGITVYSEGSVSDGQGNHIAAWDPARVLRECEAKRRIVAWFGPVDESDCSDWQPTMRALAAVYAAHPDYDSEWTP